MYSKISKTAIFFFLLLININIQAQSNDKIIGYWKKTHTLLMSDYTSMQVTTYTAFSEDSIAKYLTFYLDKQSKGSFKYWFEGNYYCTKMSTDPVVRRALLYGIDKNNFYIKRGTKNYHYTRITQEVFEKAAERLENQLLSTPSTSQNSIITTRTSKAVGFSCIVCLDTGKETCGSCSGRGQIKYSRSRSVYDYYRKTYKTEYYDEWRTCYNCVNGKVQCSNYLCRHR